MPYNTFNTIYKNVLPMKCILCITRTCNLSCSYCYIAKEPVDMTLPQAREIIDLIFTQAPENEEIRIGFFGGEPLLKPALLAAIMDEIVNHPLYRNYKVEFSLASNGTILSAAMIDFINKNRVSYCVSCDGPPEIQDLARIFRDGRGSGDLVEKTLIRAKKSIPGVFVNAVIHPQSVRKLPEIVDYFSGLGIRRIFLNPDFSAPWSADDIAVLPEFYDRVGKLYLDYFQQENPHFVSIIDSKIVAILSGGYKPDERCRMGTHEFAFAPSGYVYPCERLIGSDDGTHAIGSMNGGFSLVSRMKCPNTTSAINPECLDCGIRNYCMNWCGCSNYFATGTYDRVGSFACASERASYETAFSVFNELNNRYGSAIMQHFMGNTLRDDPGVPQEAGD